MEAGRQAGRDTGRGHKINDTSKERTVGRNTGGRGRIREGGSQGGLKIERVGWP